MEGRSGRCKPKPQRRAAWNALGRLGEGSQAGLHTLLRARKTLQLVCKTAQQFFIRLNIGVTISPSNSNPRYTFRELKSYVHKKFRKQPTYQQISGQLKYDVFIRQNIISHKKGAVLLHATTWSNL